jgi:hypothetical protein
VCELRASGYQRQVLFDPDLIVEIFVFDSQASSEARAETAESISRHS